MLLALIVGCQGVLAVHRNVAQLADKGKGVDLERRRRRDRITDSRFAPEAASHRGPAPGQHLEMFLGGNFLVMPGALQVVHVRHGPAELHTALLAHELHRRSHLAILGVYQWAGTPSSLLKRGVQYNRVSIDDCCDDGLRCSITVERSTQLMHSNTIYDVIIPPFDDAVAAQTRGDRRASRDTSNEVSNPFSETWMLQQYST